MCWLIPRSEDGLFLIPSSLPGLNHAAFVPAITVTAITFVFPANPGSFFKDLQGVACGRVLARRPWARPRDQVFHELSLFCRRRLPGADGAQGRALALRCLRSRFVGSGRRRSASVQIL